MMEKLAEFMEFYIEGRYPRDLSTIYHKFNESLTYKKMNEVKEVHQWLIKKL